MSTNAAAGDGAVDGVDEATIAVARGSGHAGDVGPAEAELADDTVAVAAPTPGHDSEATFAVSQRAADRQSGASHADPAPARTGDTQVGAPVVEPEEIPPELAKLLFKSPLDAKRRAPTAPFPAEHASLPRGGVRGGIPVVYGARGEGFTQEARGSDLGRALGPPPVGYALPLAAREGLPSLARVNRRFSALAWAGAFVVPVAAGLGLWWVLSALLRP